MNKKGFMMAELIVVSSIVMVTLTSLYLSYGKLYSEYKARLNYYDSTGLYELASARDSLIYQEKLNDLLQTTKSAPNYSLLDSELSFEYTGDEKHVYLVYNKKNNINILIIN